MRKTILLSVVGVTLLLLSASPVLADGFDFLGQTVTGTLTFNGSSGNFWDTTKGGTGAGPLVLVAGQDFASTPDLGGTVSAVFSATTIEIIETCNPGPAGSEGITCGVTPPPPGWIGWTITISGLTGLGGLSLASDTFPSGVTFSDTANSMTFTYAGGDTYATYEATFNAVGTPEPNSLMLLSMGLSATGFAILRRRKTA